MKKILLVLLLALVSAVVFAGGASEDGGYHGVTDNGFVPTLSDVKGTLTRKLYYNPAELTENKLVVEVPNASVSVFNFAKALSNKTVAEAVSRFTHLKFSKKDLMAVLTGLVNNVGTGYNDLVTLDIGLGVAVDNWAISLDAQGQIKAMPKFADGTENIDYLSGLSLTSSGFVPMMDAALSFGYGFRLFEKEEDFLDLGFAVRVADKVYVEQLTAAEIVNDFKIDEKEARSGLAFPFDVGAVYGMLDGKLLFSATVQNLNGYYYMHKYRNVNEAIVFKNGFGGYIMYTPWKLNTGVEYTPKWKYFNPVLSFRVEDINGFFANDLSKPINEIFRHMTAKVNIDIIKQVGLTAAFKNGYPEIGADVDLWGNTIELKYGFREEGYNLKNGYSYGSKPVDAFTVRVKLGYDTN